MSEHVELGWLNNAIVLVDAWQVDLRLELEPWWPLGVVSSARDLQAVDSIIELGIWWSDDGSVPVCEALVITFSETIGNGLVTEGSVLCSIQLVGESEGSWHGLHC